VQGLGTRWFELPRRQLRVLLAAAAIVVLSLLAIRGLQALRAPADFRIENARESLSLPPRLDVNTAREYELELLPGIGGKTARAIVADREQQGPYERLEDLMRVPGIGPKTVETLRPHLMCVPPPKRKH